MKLINFKEFHLMKKIRESMGIGDNASPQFLGNRISIKERQWEEIKTTGLKFSLKDLKVSENWTLEHIEFPGQKMVVYMRDYQVDLYGLPKFHISWCSTLKSMNDGGRYDKYVVNQRKDGFFTINKTEGGKVIETGLEEELKVCKYCLGKLNYKNYEKATKDQRDKIYEEFNMNEFLELFNTDIYIEPTHTDLTQPLNKYSENWFEISYEYRKSKKFICEDCGRDFKKNTRALHVHHIDGNKYNNKPSNLEAVCQECHKKKPFHDHMY